MANPTSISVEDARLYITLPALQVVDLVLKWAGMKADEGLALHPGPGHHHTEPFAIVGDQPDRYFVETAYTNRQVEEGRYTGALCVKGRDVTATTAQIYLAFEARSLTLTILPG
jgi:hypothetical protein